jgi:hypothetical protein
MADRCSFCGSTGPFSRVGPVHGADVRGPPGRPRPGQRPVPGPDPRRAARRAGPAADRGAGATRRPPTAGSSRSCASAWPPGSRWLACIRSRGWPGWSAKPRSSRTWSPSARRQRGTTTKLVAASRRPQRRAYLILHRLLSRGVAGTPRHQACGWRASALDGLVRQSLTWPGHSGQRGQDAGGGEFLPAQERSRSMPISVALATTRPSVLRLQPISLPDQRVWRWDTSPRSPAVAGGEASLRCAPRRAATQAGMHRWDGSAGPGALACPRGWPGDAGGGSELPAGLGW